MGTAEMFLPVAVAKYSDDCKLNNIKEELKIADVCSNKNNAQPTLNIKKKPVNRISKFLYPIN